jgi:PKD repeat protein
VTGATRAGGGGGEYSVVLVGADTTPVPNQPPTARTTTSCQNLTCTFDGSGSTDPDGSVTSWTWGFGDQSDPATGVGVSHSFAQAGTYPVTLTVTDDDGASAQVTTQVTVSPAPTAALVFRAARTSDGNVSRASVVVPTQVAAGDQLLLFVSTSRNATATTPAGWTLAGTVSDGVEVRSWVFTRTAVAGSAGSTVQVTLDALSKTSMSLLGYAGAGVPSATAGAAEPGTTALHRSPAAPVAATGSTVVSYWADKVSTAHGWTLPAQVTARSATVGTGSGMVTSASGDSSGTPAGTWPGATADAGAAGSKAIAWTVVLPPA